MLHWKSHLENNVGQFHIYSLIKTLAIIIISILLFTIHKRIHSSIPTLHERFFDVSGCSVKNLKPTLAWGTPKHMSDYFGEIFQTKASFPYHKEFFFKCFGNLCCFSDCKAHTRVSEFLSNKHSIVLENIFQKMLLWKNISPKIGWLFSFGLAWLGLI